MGGIETFQKGGMGHGWALDHSPEEVRQPHSTYGRRVGRGASEGATSPTSYILLPSLPSLPASPSPVLSPAPTPSVSPMADTQNLPGKTNQIVCVCVSLSQTCLKHLVSSFTLRIRT